MILDAAGKPVSAGTVISVCRQAQEVALRRLFAIDPYEIFGISRILGPDGKQIQKAVEWKPPKGEFRIPFQQVTS